MRVSVLLVCALLSTIGSASADPTCGDDICVKQTSQDGTASTSVTAGPTAVALHQVSFEDGSTRAEGVAVEASAGGSSAAAWSSEVTEDAATYDSSGVVVCNDGDCVRAYRSEWNAPWYSRNDTVVAGGPASAAYSESDWLHGEWSYGGASIEGVAGASAGRTRYDDGSIRDDTRGATVTTPEGRAFLGTSDRGYGSTGYGLQGASLEDDRLGEAKAGSWSWTDHEGDHRRSGGEYAGNGASATVDAESGSLCATTRAARSCTFVTP